LMLFCIVLTFLFIFFFSSRRRHTRCYRDWSSDVCSSDLCETDLGAPKSVSQYIANAGDGANWLERLTANLKEFKTNVQMDGALRSEERRVGKECRYRWET